MILEEGCMIALSAVMGLRMTEPLSWRSTITTLFASLTFSRILERVSQIEKDASGVAEEREGSRDVTR